FGLQRAPQIVQTLRVFGVTDQAGAHPALADIDFLADNRHNRDIAARPRLRTLQNVRARDDVADDLERIHDPLLDNAEELHARGRNARQVDNLAVLRAPDGLLVRLLAPIFGDANSFGRVIAPEAEIVHDAEIRHRLVGILPLVFVFRNVLDDEAIIGVRKIGRAT